MRVRGRRSFQHPASGFHKRKLALATLAAALVLAFAGTTGAQDAPSGSTLASVIGAGRTWEDEGSIGPGLLAGARVDRRIAGGTLAEAAVDYLRHDRSDRYVATGGTVLVTASIVQRLGRREAQPYVLGGFVVAHHSGSSGFPEISHTTMHTTSTNLGFSGGGGLAFKAGRRVQVGPEARFIALSGISGPSPVYLFWVGGRIGFGL
jgi:hypothetical protein